MALAELGSLSLASIIPGMGDAIAGIQAASDGLALLKADKDSELNNLMGRISGMSSVLTDAQNLATGAQGLLDMAQSVLDQCDTLTASLAAALSASGIHLYSYAGTAGNLGNEVSDALGATGLPGGSGSSEVVTGLILVTADAGAWAAIASVLKIS